METEIGFYDAKIVRHSIELLGKKQTPAIKMVVNVEGEEGDIMIWLTDAARNMARRQLKICGFDPDARDLASLNSMPDLLAGNEVRVEVFEDDYGGELRKKVGLVMTGTDIDEQKVANLQKMLRGETPPPKPSEDIPF